MSSLVVHFLTPLPLKSADVIYGRPPRRTLTNSYSCPISSRRPPSGIFSLSIHYRTCHMYLITRQSLMATTAPASLRSALACFACWHYFRLKTRQRGTVLCIRTVITLASLMWCRYICFLHGRLVWGRNQVYCSCYSAQMVHKLV